MWSLELHATTHSTKLPRESQSGRNGVVVVLGGDEISRLVPGFDPVQNRSQYCPTQLVSYPSPYLPLADLPSCLASAVNGLILLVLCPLPPNAFAPLPPKQWFIPGMG